MLHAPTSENKTTIAPGTLPPAPQPARELHPQEAGQNDVHPGVVHRRAWAGVQKAYGNQAVLGMLEVSKAGQHGVVHPVDPIRQLQRAIENQAAQRSLAAVHGNLEKGRLNFLYSYSYS